MIDGPSVDRHHWVPRSHGGTTWGYIHRICHAKIHAQFEERDLAAYWSTAERLLADEDIAKFVRWVRRMPPEYIGRHAPRRKDRRRSCARPPAKAPSVDAASDSG